MYDDSDFFATVWDAAEGRTREIQYATTRGWTYPNWATIDATPEARESADVYHKAQHAKARKLAEERAIEAAKLEAEAQVRLADTPGKGQSVLITKGKYKGREGVCIWAGLSKSGRNPRVGIIFARGGDPVWLPGTSAELTEGGDKSLW
jgi:hypothetical protein